MLFNSGNPSLVGRTRHYANDPSTAANPRFADQEVKDAINVRYLELRDLIAVSDDGTARKRAYADGVAVDSPDDHFYSLPADFVRRLRVEISSTAKDLSTTLPGSDPDIVVLEPIAYDAALDFYYKSEGTESARYVFRHDMHFGISPPLTATEAGTKSIRITYEASTTLLSGDTDEPDLPRPHHDVIALGAAMDLLAGQGLPVNDLAAIYTRKERFLVRASGGQVANYDGQIAVAGRKPSRRFTNFGRTRRM